LTGRSAGNQILILTGDAAESLEVMYPYQRLLEECYEVHIAAPSVKKLQFVVHDFVDGYDTYTEKAGYTWPATWRSPTWIRPTTRPWSSRAAGRRSTSAATPTYSASSSTS
jgi:hypothetical protein